MEEAQRLCDDIVIVDKGHVIAHGSPDALVTQHLPAVIARLPAQAWPGDAPLPENSELRNGFIEMFADEEHRLLEQLESSGANLGDLKIESPNLEDLFLKLTGHALRN
jgi:ABC-2 type transport system ATP-binding protein